MARAILFDLFETLISEFDPNWTPGPGTGARIGIDDSVFDELWRQMRDRRMRGRIDFRDALLEISRLANRSPDAEAVDRVIAERLLAKARPFEKLDPRILDLVAELDARDVRLAVVSNASEEEVAAWRGCALAQVFDAAVFSFEVGRVKPESEIYRIACRKLGTRPDDAIFIGDGGADELEGAARTGMRPYWATWFLDCWPPHLGRHDFVAGARRYPRLREPAEALGLGQDR